MPHKYKISVIIPMKNESSGISFLFERLLSVLNKLDMNNEIIVIDDGSTDDTLNLLLKQQKTTPQLKIIDLSRNFGKEAALYAGFEHATGDCAVAIDADLQHPPELIEEMVNFWNDGNGFEIVTAVRSTRDCDTFLKKRTSGFFYRLINKISDTKIIPNSGDFRLLDKKAVKAFLSLHERVRFNKGIFSWLGFKEKIIMHPLEERASGVTQWNYIKLIKFSIDGITSFSQVPLEIWTYIGTLLFGVSTFSAIYYLIKTLIFGNNVPGYTSLIILILFFGGIQLISVGMLGQYMGRIFLEVKQRPIYIARNIFQSTKKDD